MKNNELYASLLDKMKQSLVLSPDLPDETVESTLKALWLHAGGSSCSAKKAAAMELPELSASQESELQKLVASRLDGIPLMQITGYVNFMNLELAFGSDVFIVRPETEILGNSAVEFLRARPKPVMIDMGCGSGNLTCGIASALPELAVYAVDILQSCVDLTLKNIELCGITNAISVYQGDGFIPLDPLNLEGKVDAVICNPPYIASSRLEGDRAYLLSHEPIEAFDGGPFGIKMHQRLIKESPQFLKPDGALLFEFGAGQDKQVRKLIERAGGFEKIEFSADAEGTPRVVIARK